jgi:MSHA biogenesis protein MshK
MVKPLNSIVRTWVVQGSVLLSALTLAPLAAGQNMSDPTRPPASFGSGQEPGFQPTASGPVLQSVLIAPGRKVAIISGQTVSLGEKFGDARLIKITESEVTLSGSNGMQTLKLFPGVEIYEASNRKRPQADRRRQ